MSDLATFNSQISKWAKDRPWQEVSKNLKWLALALLEDIVDLTPVDTGRCRGNWQVEVNSSNDSAIDIQGSAEDMKAAVMARARKALAQAGRAKFPTIHIFNNVPYVIYLEEGTTREGDDGVAMVARSIAARSLDFD